MSSKISTPNISNLLLRLAMAVILLAHSIPGMFDGGVMAFGEHYLNQVGFSPIGVPIAWAVKLSHTGAAILIILNKYVKLASIISIIILITGIFMIHMQHGWFVVGGGSNGVEYNFILITILITFILNDKKIESLE